MPSRFPRRSTRRGPRTSTGPSASSGAAPGTTRVPACTTPSPNSVPSWCRARRWTPRCAAAGRRCTCPTARCRCTRPWSPRTPRACCLTARVRRCCGGSTWTARASRCRSRYTGRWSGRGPASTTPVCRPPSTPGTSIRRSRRSRRSGRCAAPAVRRGAIELELPEQEVVRVLNGGGLTDGGWTVRVRQRPGRGLERGDLAAHRHHGGADYARRRDRHPAHPPAAGPEAVTALRAVARGSGSTGRAQTPAELLSALPRDTRRAGPAPGRARRCCGAPATPHSTRPPVRGPPPTPATRGSARHTRTSRRRCDGSSTASARKCASP